MTLDDLEKMVTVKKISKHVPADTNAAKTILTTFVDDWKEAGKKKAEVTLKPSEELKEAITEILGFSDEESTEETDESED